MPPGTQVTLENIGVDPSDRPQNQRELGHIPVNRMVDCLGEILVSFLLAL